VEELEAESFEMTAGRKEFLSFWQSMIDASN
jgi:hypothetical protein